MPFSVPSIPTIWLLAGYAFLNELNAIPNVDGVAQGVKDLQGFMDGMISRFQVTARTGSAGAGGSTSDIMITIYNIRAHWNQYKEVWRLSNLQVWMLLTELTWSSAFLDRKSLIYIESKTSSQTVKQSGSRA